MVQRSGNSRRVEKQIDLQHPFSSESCRSSTVDHDEEMTLESPRKRQEVQDRWRRLSGRRREEAKKMHGGWNQKGKRRCRRPESLRTGLKASTWTSMVKATMDGGKLKIPEVKVTCQEKKAKKLKARREKNWVEAEETQDCVREAKDTDQEEAEELSFVPSAISVPQQLMFRCDNQCSEKALSVWQLASVVFQECEESYTTNTCQGKRRKTLTNWKWRQFAG